MSSRTYRIGLIGAHIGTSMSPTIQRAEAEAHGLTNFRYELIDLEDHPDATGQLGQIIAEQAAAGFTGFNVTHPYKQQVIAHLDGLSDAARTLGAVNNLVRNGDQWIGHNTDHSGFLAGLRNTLPADAARNAVVLFGAGGAGAAVASALLDFGVQQLRVIDTQPTQREHLQEQLSPTLTNGAVLQTGGPEMAADWVPTANAVVNATPIGMEHLPGTPFDVELLTADQWVADVIYRPVETRLLAAARRLGCATVDGTAMLVEQAAGTFELQTGLPANRGRMRDQMHRTMNT